MQESEESKKPEKVIVISGPPGSGSTTIASRIADELDLRLLVPGKLHKGIVDEKEEGKAALEAWKTEKGKSKETHVNRDMMQAEEAGKGNIVVCGKLSIHFINDMSDFKIWLDVPLEERARRTAERDKISFAQAMKEIKERQEIEREEWKRIYGFDYLEQKNEADLVIDSSDMTVDETVDRILAFIRMSAD